MRKSFICSFETNDFDAGYGQHVRTCVSKPSSEGEKKKETIDDSSNKLDDIDDEVL